MNKLIAEFTNPNGRIIQATIEKRSFVDVYTKSNKYLFSLVPNDKNRAQSITAKDLYSKGIQWFSPNSENYLEMHIMSKEIFAYQELKHFSWKDIVDFGEIDRSMFEYRTGGSGDWKKQGNPGDGYLLVTVGGMPYWTDAIGQIPFTLNCFRIDLRGFCNYDTASKSTYLTGVKWGRYF